MQSDDQPGPKPIGSLSKREREVLALVAEGQTYSEIGRRLYLSTHTVDTYLRRIKKKTGLTDRSDLIVLFIENNECCA